MTQKVVVSLVTPTTLHKLPLQGREPIQFLPQCSTPSPQMNALSAYQAHWTLHRMEMAGGPLTGTQCSALLAAQTSSTPLHLAAAPPMSRWQSPTPGQHPSPDMLVKKSAARTHCSLQNFPQVSASHCCTSCNLPSYLVLSNGTLHV